MENKNFRNLCITDTLNGLCDGLSHFSRPSRVALLYAINPDDPIYVCDPQNLLEGHEPKFKELYLESDLWRANRPKRQSMRPSGYITVEQNLDLAGLISFGARSRSLFYQMWFTEHHPDMCAIGPTERWLEHAAWRLSHDLANEDDLYTGISGFFLSEYATHAVRDHIVDEMNIILGMDSLIRVYPILDAVLGISRTREEGQSASGKIMFIEPGTLSNVAFLVRFPRMEQPTLDNFKHVRKLLLSVEDSERSLISDGKTILGICADIRTHFKITADFRGGYGFLRVNDNAVCSFSDGRFYSSTRRANLVQVEEALLESDMDPEAGSTLYKIITCIVHHAEEQGFGCTLVIDLNSKPESIAGQTLEPPVDLTQPHLLDLAMSIAKVDGALHIGADLHLHGFACLLDGRAISGEDRSRGARYNSALRFTAERKNFVVVVVSSDRPVSIIQEGIEPQAQCRWKPLSGCTIPPKRLDEWLKR